MPPPPAGKGIDQSIGGYQCICPTAHALAGLRCLRALPVQPAAVRSCCSHAGFCPHAFVGCSSKDCARKLVRGPGKTGLQPDPGYPSAVSVSVRQLAAHQHPAALVLRSWLPRQHCSAASERNSRWSCCTAHEKCSPSMRATRSATQGWDAVVSAGNLSLSSPLLSSTVHEERVRLG